MICAVGIIHGMIKISRHKDIVETSRRKNILIIVTCIMYIRDARVFHRFITTILCNIELGGR